MADTESARSLTPADLFPPDPGRPTFADNCEGRTLAAALRSHIDHLSATRVERPTLSVAAGYFNLGGFLELADRLEKLGSVRLLLGAEPTPPPLARRREPGDPVDPARAERKALRASLDREDAALRADRDDLPFTPRTTEALRTLMAALQSGQVEVRRYEKRFLHGKAYLFSGPTGQADGDPSARRPEGVLCGSSNFTAAGLCGNLELNLGHYQPETLKPVAEWFERLWDEAEPYDLAAIYAARFEEYDPHLIFLRVLWELYRDELEADEDESATSGREIPLTGFQSDGLLRARRILEGLNGVLIADGVGLGKSFIAGELMRDAIQERRQRVLLIAPAALRDGMWQRFKIEHGLEFEVLSYEELRDCGSLGGEGAARLAFAPDEYAMVVVDEAQAFRNPAADRSATLRRLLAGTTPKKLVLLSATPVNNSLWDLYHLLSLFVPHDAAFSARGIRSLRERFREAAAIDPFELNPDLLFDVLDAVTVRRTRRHVREHYKNARITLRDGSEMIVKFPEPVPRRVDYEFGDELSALFDELADALDPPDGAKGLTLARYEPSAYLRGAAEAEASERALAGLIRSGLLKRFESSRHAFAVTCDRMAKTHDGFLQGLEKGVLLTTEAIRELGETDNDEDWFRLLEVGEHRPAAGYDVDRLRADVTRDRNLLRNFSVRAGEVAAETDPKLSELVEVLAACAADAAQEAVGPDDERRRRKVLLFSYFADTAAWIDEHLREAIENDPRLAAYRDRVATVIGQQSYHGVDRRDAVFGFAPESSQAPAGEDADRFDLLITTDILAEGVNLQDCRNLLNYDLPWNPMRLVQRHGRIDRIGSKHDRVFVHCMFPDRRLNDLLNLEGRIRHKLAQASASIGIEGEVIPDAPTGDRVFDDGGDRAEIERIRQEDPTLFEQGGVDAAHSGEEFRQILLRGMERRGEEVLELPGAAPSGLARGPRRGHFFCARVGERVFLRFVAADPQDGAEPIERNTLRCLQAIDCTEDTERRWPPDLAEQAFAAWEHARADVFATWMKETDPREVQPRVGKLFRQAVAHLRVHPPAGLDDAVLRKSIDALQAPWSERYRRELREVFDPDAPGGAETSSKIVKCVDRLGMRPVEKPRPLPPISPDDVRLVCWMLVESKAP